MTTSTLIRPAIDTLSHEWLAEIAQHDPCITGMPAADAAAVANRVMLHLYRGSIEQARDALEDGWQSHVKEQQPLPYGPSLLIEPLARVIDDVRLLNALEGQGIDTIGDLLGVSEAELLSIPSFGNASLAKLRNIAVGLRMRAEQGRDESEVTEAVA